MREAAASPDARHVSYLGEIQVLQHPRQNHRSSAGNLQSPYRFGRCSWNQICIQILVCGGGTRLGLGERRRVDNECNNNSNDAILKDSLPSHFYPDLALIDYQCLCVADNRRHKRDRLLSTICDHCNSLY